MVADDLERWADMGILGLDVQVYDLTAASSFVWEICDANSKASAPLFASGLPPAKAFVVAVDLDDKKSVCVMVSRASETHVQCDFVSALEAYQAGREAALLRKKVMGMLDDAPSNVCDMLGISAESPVADFDRKYITNERAKFMEEESGLATVEIGAPCPQVDGWAASILHICSAACEFMAMPIATKEPAQLPRAARRRLERTGRGVSLVTVGITRSVAAGCKRLPSGDHGRALHFVSGHWRLSEASLHRKWVFDGWRIWIEGHWRGDPAYGVLLHRYVARAA